MSMRQDIIDMVGTFPERFGIEERECADIFRDIAQHLDWEGYEYTIEDAMREVFGPWRG